MSLAATHPSLQSQFDEQGYIVLRGFLEPAILAGVRAELEKLVEADARRLVAEGKIAHGFEHEPFETRYARLFEQCLHEDSRRYRYRENLQLPGFFPLFFHPRLLDIVEGFLGPEIRLYPNYTVRPKLPEWDGTRVLWHQDGGYTAGGTEGVGGLRMLNVWTPLVPATVANGCMQFIPGTHKLGVLPHEPRRFYLEIAPAVLEPLLPRAVNMEAQVGDVLLFSNLLLHQGLPNRTAEVRWTVDWRYQDASQSTLRRQAGHLARSRSCPAEVVRDAADWASRTFE